ncbi:MAG: peptide deformylase [Spirochaetota bacterium]|nr:peptide deformylase [Spirochaetota bacterium]
MLDIVTLGDDVLRQNTEEILDIDEEIVRLIDAMLESMYHGDGIGLAGPQVGVLRQIFVCHAQNDQPRIFINPQIIATSQEQLPYEEGCLSIPGVWGDVIRPQTITVQAVNEKGKPFRIDADGILARVIQHEMDHLKGVLFIDHLEENARNKVLKIYDRKQRK